MYKLRDWKDCKHFAPSKVQGLKEADKIEYGKCKLFREKNLITGTIEYEYASTCRVTRCKKEGVYFEPKEES